ncbi:MAG: STAS/SEC14 domain-containing protein [Boseongicola sp.]|nr:MAG: STAS/SEC14 domain-containing protein [Boseongicola sp.]
MFDLTKDAKGFYRLAISGKIDEDDMKKGLDAFLAVTDAAPKTDFLYTISEFELPTFQAIAVEFGYFPRLFGCLNRIGKVALVADQTWLRKAAEIEAFLIPGLSIETFEEDQEPEAIAWLTKP